MNTLKPYYSSFALRSLEPSPVNEMTESFANDFRENVDINLGVGYVNDKTIPNAYIQQALAEVVQDVVKYRNALNYGGAEGSPALKNSIRQYYLRNKIGTISEREFEDIKICIGANGATSLLENFADIFEPGIVITADPFYYIYCDTLIRKGFKVVAVPEESDGINIEILKDRLAEIDPSELRFLYIVTVNNPSCTVLSNPKRQELVAIASQLSQKHGRLIPLIFDRAYEDIIHDSSIELPVSGLKYDNLNLVLEIGTFSKLIAPALRIGYLLTKNHEIAKMVNQKISDIGFSAPLINQEITSWLLDNCIEQQRDFVKNGYREKSKLIRSFIFKELGEYVLDIKGGGAGFYFYLTLNVETHKKSDFYKFLNRITGDSEVDGVTEKLPRLVYIPGVYCVSKDGEMENISKNQLRISYGFESVDQIKKAILLIKDAVEYSLSLVE